LESFLGVEDYAKYPFLPESISYALRRNPNLSVDKIDSIEIMGFEPKVVLDVTRKRLLTGIKTGVSPKLDDVHHEISLVSFIISMIAVRFIDDQVVYSRFAIAEARRSEGYLLEEIEKNPRGKDVAKVIFEKVSNVKLNQLDQGFLIPLSDFIKFSVKGETSWKLVNRWVYMGNVYVKHNELAHMFREISMKSIIERINKMPKPAVKGSLLELIKEIEEAKPRPRTIAYTGKMPPCVEFQMNQLKQGVNIPHSARFLLATYLINIGWNTEDIVELFRTAPDFNEKITKYQVMQISGAKGSGTKYMVPSCEKLLTLNLCKRDETCDNIKNPLQYGRFKKRT
jgi:DNA primase large subunit